MVLEGVTGATREKSLQGEFQAQSNEQQKSTVVL